MNMPDEYYIKNLYPFQDGIIKIIKSTPTPFYLTGGTILGRHYFNHRYSDDLDFFVNFDKNYRQYVRDIIDKLEKYQTDSSYLINKDKIVAEESFTQITITQQFSDNGTELKIDLINDVSERFGQVLWDNKFGKIDNVKNILCNKLTALYRLEPKDIADIWIISKNTNFDWNEIVDCSKRKEVGIDILKLSEIIETFPIDYIDIIKWINRIDASEFIKDLNIISDDIFNGRKNSLC